MFSILKPLQAWEDNSWYVVVTDKDWKEFSEIWTSNNLKSCYELLSLDLDVVVWIMVEQKRYVDKVLSTHEALEMMKEQSKDEDLIKNIDTLVQRIRAWVHLKDLTCNE